MCTSVSVCSISYSECYRRERERDEIVVTTEMSSHIYMYRIIITSMMLWTHNNIVLNVYFSVCVQFHVQSVIIERERERWVRRKYYDRDVKSYIYIYRIIITSMMLWTHNIVLNMYFSVCVQFHIQSVIVEREGERWVRRNDRDVKSYIYIYIHRNLNLLSYYIYVMSCESHSIIIVIIIIIIIERYTREKYFPRT
jgi:hypothetical protein